MGLDVTGYQKIVKLDCVFDADGEPIYPQTKLPIEGDYFRAYLNPDFPGRADEIEDRGVYRYAKSFHFRAGAYSYYNRWREILARVCGYPAMEFEGYAGTKETRHDAGARELGKGPFYELIWFSDCEGILGAATCQKLLGDFKVVAFPVDDVPFMQSLANWKHVLELGAEEGAVRFA